jgi:hypothetical protein
LSHREETIRNVFNLYYRPMLEKEGLTKGEMLNAERLWVSTMNYGYRAPGAAVKAADALIAPYIKPRKAYLEGVLKCDYCGRPNPQRGDQCGGCGAWRKDLR